MPMKPADEMAGRIEPSAGAVAGSNGKLDEQLRVSVEKARQNYDLDLRPRGGRSGTQLRNRRTKPGPRQ